VRYLKDKEKELLKTIKLRNRTLTDLLSIEDSIAQAKNTLLGLERLAEVKDAIVCSLNDEILELEVEICDEY
jgi:hypothetical protein